MTFSDDFTALSDGCGETGSATVTFTATDDCGHIAVETRDVTVDNTPPTAEIVSPLPCTSADGLVEVIGTSFDANLSSWTLQYTGGSQNGWVTIATGTTNVINDLLAVWDTGDLEACCYTLRLLVDDEAIIDCNGAINQNSGYLVSLDVGTACPADLDGDMLIGFGDLLNVLSNWGPCP